LDTELNRLNRSYTAISAQAAKLRADCEENNKAREIAEDISKETDLTRAQIICHQICYNNEAHTILWCGLSK